jgi:hypothetical protein
VCASFETNGERVCKEIRYRNMLISKKFCDSWVLISDPEKDGGPCIFRVLQFVLRKNRTGLCDVTRDLFVVGRIYPSKRDYYVSPIRSSLQQEYVFKNVSSGVLYRFPVTWIVGKLYVFPRFVNLPKCLLTLDMLGAVGVYENVEEWVGVALRHV